NYCMSSRNFPAKKMPTAKWLVLVFIFAATFSRAQMTNSENTNSVSEASNAIPVLRIQADKVTAHASPTLYGLMTEEINYSYEGGLYGELIRNRTFKANPTSAIFWSPIGSAIISLDTNQPLNSALNVSLKLDTSKATKKSPAGIANGGYWGIPVRPHT